MRIFFFTDVHQSTHPPRMRTASYESQIFEKLEQIIKPAQKSDWVIFGGDLFHSKKPENIPYALTNRLMDIFREFGRTLIVPGNHDFDTSSTDIFGKSPIATLTKLPNVELLMNHGFDTDDNVHIYGVGGGEFFTPEQYVQMATDHVAFVGKGKHKVGVFHASVTDKKYPFPVIPVGVFEKHFDLLLLGHLHDYQKVEGTVVAPGAISRGVLKLDDNFFREVGYATVDVVGGRFQTQFVPLEIYPADQVFRMDAKQRQIEDVAAVGSLLQFIESMDIPRPQTTERLTELIMEMELDPVLKERALKILREVTEHGS